MLEETTGILFVVLTQHFILSEMVNGIGNGSTVGKGWYNFLPLLCTNQREHSEGMGDDMIFMEAMSQ